MKILVSGSRTWGGWDAQTGAYTLPFDVERTEKLARSFNTDDIVVEGEAAGADSLIRDACMRLGIEVRKYSAHWRHNYYGEKGFNVNLPACGSGCPKIEGKAAGVLRNQEMLDREAPSVVIWCHNNLAESRGTRDMVRRAMVAGVPVHSIDDWLKAH